MTIKYTTSTYGTAFTKGIPINAYIKHNHGEQSLVFYWTGITHINSIYRIYCYMDGGVNSSEIGVYMKSVCVPYASIPVTVIYI